MLTFIDDFYIWNSQTLDIPTATWHQHQQTEKLKDTNRTEQTEILQKIYFSKSYKLNWKGCFSILYSASVNIFIGRIT